jgi:hypothetical protein
MNRKIEKVNISENNAANIVNELAKNELSKYKTVGELVGVLKPLLSLIGIEQANISEEDKLRAENDRLKKEIENLKKNKEVNGTNIPDN